MPKERLERLRLDAIKRDIETGRVNRTQMDHIVHVGLSDRKKEKRDAAVLLVELAVNKGIEISDSEMKEINEAHKSAEKALRLRAIKMTSIRGLKRKYKNFLENSVKKTRMKGQRTFVLKQEVENG